MQHFWPFNVRGVKKTSQSLIKKNNNWDLSYEELNTPQNHSLRRSISAHILLPVNLQHKQDCTYKWETRPLPQDPQSDGDSSSLNRGRHVRRIHRGALRHSNIGRIEYLHWWKTPPAGTITEWRGGSEGSFSPFSTESGSPQGATAPRRKGISYLGIITVLSTFCWWSIILKLILFDIICCFNLPWLRQIGLRW